jgi:phosphate transport system substrate-binding protein
VSNLTKAQVAKIFTGQIKDWSEIGGTPGPISIYTRNTSSGTYKDWQKLAMGGRDYPTSSLKMAGNEQIAQEVAKNKGGIGYVGLAYATTRGVKAVNINGVQPIASNERKYEYARQCYLYMPDKPTAEAQAFMNFVLSPAGQNVVQSTGFIRIK